MKYLTGHGDHNSGDGEEGGGDEAEVFHLEKDEIGSGWVLKRRGELVLRRDEMGLALSLVFPPRQCYRTEMWAAA